MKLTWPEQFELSVKSRSEWVVVYDEQDEAVCVEPQSGPPNGLNTAPRLGDPDRPAGDGRGLELDAALEPMPGRVWPRGTAYPRGHD
ncbi:hypothetical protein SCALM49S_05967 [Streptomyces californicus]